MLKKAGLQPETVEQGTARPTFSPQNCFDTPPGVVSVSDAFCENETVPWSLQFDATLGLLVLHAGGKPAHVAQLVEHVLGKDEVTGSIPVMGSSLSSRQGRQLKMTQFLFRTRQEN